MSDIDKRWIEPPEVAIPQAILNLVGAPHFLAEALVRRGLSDEQRLREYLDPGLYEPGPPSALPDLYTATDRLERAIRLGETIGVWGDFDVDGQTATALLVQALSALDAKVKYTIPLRERDSHGVALPALRAYLDTGVNLVLTCDTGISAHDAVELARERGVDFIITDHHSLPDTLPAAVAVVNSQRLPAGAPLATLCGVGCAYKLAEELLARANHAELAAHLLDLVALGTVADLAFLTGDNRFLVQRGLERLRSAPRPAVEAILELNEVSPGQVTEEQISFILAPRLNALGRLADANPAVPFLLSGSLAEVRPMAARLEALNARRKLLCDQVFQAAQAQLDRDRSLLDQPVILLGHPAWPGGVLGIVASRLTELYRKPAIVLATPPGELARGSARSIAGVNITQAIGEAHHLLNTFGGHPMAAGVSLDSVRIAEFHHLINRAVTQQQSQAPSQVANLEIDAFVPLADLTLEMVESLERLAPFGPGNPPLTMAARNLELQSQSQFGKNGEHMQLIVEDSSAKTQKVIWWQGAGLPMPEGRFDMAFTVRASNYRGQRAVQVEWVGFRVIPESIPLRKQRIVQRILDHRNEIDPSSALAPWLVAPDTLIFAEGEIPFREKSVDRNHLTAAQNLVIWTAPPSRDVLQTILDIVAPRQVIWFGTNPGADQAKPFLTRLTGLVRYTIKSRQGRAALPELAAAVAQSEKIVKAGAAWLAARGYITVKMDDDQLQIASGGKSDLDLANRLDRDIAYLLQESAAFRAYCQKVDLRSLIL